MMDMTKAGDLMDMVGRKIMLMVGQRHAPFMQTVIRLVTRFAAGRMYKW